MSMVKIILPELGEGIEKATVACWHRHVGEKVSFDEDIVEVVTDKASFNVSTHQEGILKEILVPEGKDAKVGEALAVIE